MTDHPCKGMTKAQRAAFERVAINEPASAGSETIEALLAAGVIVRGEPKVSRDCLGSFTIPTYLVPLGVHAQWCQWCSEQAEV